MPRSLANPLPPGDSGRAPTNRPFHRAPALLLLAAAVGLVWDLVFPPEPVALVGCEVRR